MARPRLEDDKLKHPRRYRKSSTRGEVLEDIPKPTQTEIKRWEPLVEACTMLVIRNDRLDNIKKKAKIRLWLPSKWSITSELPPCKCEGKNKLTTINAELVLLWLYQHRLARYSPNMLYVAKQKHVAGLTLLETSMENEVSLKKMLERSNLSLDSKQDKAYDGKLAAVIFSNEEE